MKQLQMILQLGVLIVLLGVGFAAFSQDASGTALEIFKLGKGAVKVAAALFIAVGIYVAAKTLPR